MSLSNMGGSDRIIRLVVGVAILALTYFTGAVPTGLLTIIAYIVGAIMVVTAVTGICPLYTLLGIKTKKG
ncbi:YgaP family membrane protein [Parvularcula lutaonensis]|uniref:DUF2892 domain-containing protein n=1 Tax=Parvularcula lutaonensis TaxID=491923 RepID=A0ABV7M916_9PROT|nr:DUF2892 domain-containing protein [Parvularcula lutaonensis]GGY41148.1 hypothetical protein GCM10007148_07160 [Parvularcula lutaonensis]